MMKSFRRILIVGFLIYNFGFNAQSLAQDRPVKKINWGMTALSAAMWIPWLAKEAKIYEKNGLDVEIVLLRGSGQSSQALLGGSLFAAPVALPQVMLANLTGADMVNVAHTIASASSKLVVKPEIQQARGLARQEGLRLPAIGSLGDFLFRYTLRKYGVDPNREITWLSIGTNAERLQALLTGAIDGADVTYPADVQAERKGYRVLIDARKEITYPTTSIVTRRKTIQEDRDTVMRFVRSHVEGIAFHKQNKEFSLKVLTKYVRTTDPEFFEGSYAILQAGFHRRALSDHERVWKRPTITSRKRDRIFAAISRKSLSTRASSPSSTRAGSSKNSTNSDNDKEQGARSEEHGAAEKTPKSEGHRVRRQKRLSHQVFNRCECDSPQLAVWT